VKYRHQIVIDCPVSEVFAYMDDVEREKEWQPGIKEASKDPPGPTEVGTRKRYVSEFLGRPVRNTYVTSSFQPDERVVYETTSDSVLRARVELTFEPTESGTRVTMQVQAKPTGVLRFIPRAILEGTARKELETSFVLLKRELEKREE
jgi:carbon monoxide dehydrogenase subunit G